MRVFIWLMLLVFIFNMTLFCPDVASGYETLIDDIDVYLEEPSSQEAQEESIASYVMLQQSRLIAIIAYLNTLLSIVPNIKIKDVYQSIGPLNDYQHLTLEDYYKRVELEVFRVFFQRNQRLLAHDSIMNRWKKAYVAFIGKDKGFDHYLLALKMELDSRGSGFSLGKQDTRDLQWYEAQACLDSCLYHNADFLARWEACYIENHWLYNIKNGSYKESLYLYLRYKRCKTSEEKRSFLQRLFRVYVNARHKMQFYGCSTEITVQPKADNNSASLPRNDGRDNLCALEDLEEAVATSINPVLDKRLKYIRERWRCRRNALVFDEKKNIIQAFSIKNNPIFGGSFLDE